MKTSVIGSIQFWPSPKFHWPTAQAQQEISNDNSQKNFIKAEAALLFSSLYMAAFRGLARLLGQQTRLNPTSSSSLIPPSHLVFRRGIASKLFVGGLSFYTTDKALSEAFSQYGQVVEVMDRVSDRSKGFGFVTFASEDEAQNAMQDMNGKVLNGRVIFVDNAKPTVRFSSSDGMPIARGPPGPKSDN